jgi:formate hydrogenlyase subunit 4
LEGIGRFRPAKISLVLKFFKQTILSLIGVGVKSFLAYLKIFIYTEYTWENFRAGLADCGMV